MTSCVIPIAGAERDVAGARLAAARSGAVATSVAIAWSSASAVLAPSTSPAAASARTTRSSATTRSVRLCTARDADTVPPIPPPRARRRDRTRSPRGPAPRADDARPARTGRCFDKSALPSAQLGEPDEAVRRHRRPRRGQFAGRRGQLLLGLEPGAAPHADRRVLRAAHREQRPQSPFLAEDLQPRAPLRRAIVIAHAIAGGDHVARRQADTI